MADLLNNGILTRGELNQLEVVRRKIDIITNEYLMDPNDPNFAYIQKRYFPGFKGQDTVAATQLHNVGSGIGYAIASVIAHFVGNPVGELDLDLNKTIQDLVGCGYGAIPLELQDGAYQNNYVPAYNYVLRDGTSYVFRFYTQERSDNLDVLDYFILRQKYDTTTIENELFKFNTSSFAGEGTPVSLDSIEQTRNLQEVIKTGLDRPAIWTVSFRDNLDENVSLIDKIRNLIYSIDKNMVMFDQQFAMNTESFILMKGIQPNHVINKLIANGNRVDYSQVGKVHFAKEHNADIKFINNKNELIETAIAYEKEKYKKISGIASIPMDFLTGESASGAIGAGSRSILHGSFIKQIKTYRELLKPIINSIYETVGKAQNGLNTERSRPDMFSKDDNELVAELVQAISNGLISQRQAVMKYQDIHEEELDNELERILEDNVLVASGSVNEKQGIQTGGSDGEGEQQSEEVVIQ